MINEKKIVVTILIFSFGNMGPPPPLDGKSDTHFPFLPNCQHLFISYCVLSKRCEGSRSKRCTTTSKGQFALQASVRSTSSLYSLLEHNQRIKKRKLVKFHFPQKFNPLREQLVQRPFLPGVHQHLLLALAAIYSSQESSTSSSFSTSVVLSESINIVNLLKELLQQYQISLPSQGSKSL